MADRKKAAAVVAWGFALAAVAVGVVAPRTAEARRGSRTLHVQVNEEGGDEVSISVPVVFAKAALRIAGTLDMELEGEDVEVEEMREAWTALRESGESAVIDVKDGQDNVHITNAKGLVTVDVEGHDENVRIRVPEGAIDALLSGTGNKLDLAAALDALEDAHVGDIVYVEDGPDRVRIWID